MRRGDAETAIKDFLPVRNWCRSAIVSLLTAHKILISIAIVFFALLSLHEWRAAGADAGRALEAFLLAGLAAALGFYLRWVFVNRPGAPRRL